MATTASGPATTAGQKTTHPFTCITCSVAFRSSELQRSHMRSDWHRYNLKRRVASLPPLSSEVFAEKVLSAQASSRAAAEKASFEKHCSACDKTYFSENAFRNHLGSQKHRMNEVALGAAPDNVSVSSMITSTASLGGASLGGELEAAEEADDPAMTAEFQEVINSMNGAKIEEVPANKRPSRAHNAANSQANDQSLSDGTQTPSQAGTMTSTAMPINRCLFCNFDSENLYLSLDHMSRLHGLFIPEKEYIDDLEGLVGYLQAKVTENMECICCHKLKNTVAAIQTHMRDKSHCKIAFDTDDELLEIGQFYDFRATYSDDSDDRSDSDEDREAAAAPSKSSKLGSGRPQTEQDGDSEEEWEDDDDSQDDGSITPTRKNHRQLAQAYEVDGELFLPSGRMAGHRSGARFYKQNLHSYPTAEQRAERKLLSNGGEEESESPAGTSSSSELALARRKNYEAKRSQVVSRANGGLGMKGVGDDTRRDVKREEDRERKKMLRAMQRQIYKVQSGQTKRAVIHNTTFA